MSTPTGPDQPPDPWSVRPPESTPQDHPTAPPPGYQPAPPPPGYPSGQSGYAQPRPASNGVATASLVLGIVGLIPVIGLLPAIIGLILGFVGLGRARRGAGKRGLAIGGLVCSLLGIALSGVVLVAGFWFVGKVANCTDQTNYPTKQAKEQCIKDKTGLDVHSNNDLGTGNG